MVTVQLSICEFLASPFFVRSTVPFFGYNINRCIYIVRAVLVLRKNRKTKLRIVYPNHPWSSHLERRNDVRAQRGGFQSTQGTSQLQPSKRHLDYSRTVQRVTAVDKSTADAARTVERQMEAPENEHMVSSSHGRYSYLLLPDIVCTSKLVLDGCIDPNRLGFLLKPSTASTKKVVLARGWGGGGAVICLWRRRLSVVYFLRYKKYRVFARTEL